MTKGGWNEFDHPLIPSKEHSSQSNSKKEQLDVRVQRIKVGKRGKTVTTITGLELNLPEAKRWLKTLKTHCGVGGTLKGNLYQLQGDQVDTVLACLRKEGYRPKKVGG